MSLRRLLRSSLPFWLLLTLLLAGPSFAQNRHFDSPLQARQQLDQADAQLRKLHTRLDGTVTVTRFNELAEQSADVADVAGSVAQSLLSPLAEVSARLTQLGEPQAGAKEDPALVQQRRRLQQQQQELDSTLKRARLLVTDARQVSDTIERLRARQLGSQLSERVASPLSPALWTRLGKALPDDLLRLHELGYQASAGLQKALIERSQWLLWGALLVAVLLALPLRWWLGWLGRRYASGRAPGGRLRRSGLALWMLLVGTGCLGLAALVLSQSLQAFGAVPSVLQQAVTVFVPATFVAAFIAALATSLLVPAAPSWRLVALDDKVARRLRWYVQAIALLAWFNTLAIELQRAAGTSGAMLTALEGVVALLYVLLIVAALACLVRGREAELGDGVVGLDEGRGSSVIVLVRILGYLAVSAALLAVLFGYINLALMLAVQVVWVTVVISALGLVSAFVDDLLGWLTQPEGRFSRRLSQALGAPATRIEQVGVLVSAALRILLVLAGLVALLAPYGTTLSVFSGWFDQLVDGVHIGGLVVTPFAVARALLAMAVGLWLVHMVQHWLVNTYLPKTSLEPSSRNSVSMVARYLGWTLVALATLKTFGVGLGQLALVLSALSVGIGFGLQAITQNFISGLILLAERPVKIGDWVRIGDQEGDIRRINVRATEIQVGDRSTLIVPNSELITKSVRNMTLANPMGRLQLQFAVPLGTDVARVRALLLEIFAAHEKVRSEPAPSVYIDSLNGGVINLNSYAYVGSPRDTYAVRSDLLFALLTRLGEEGVALQSPQDLRIVRDEV